MWSRIRWLLVAGVVVGGAWWLLDNARSGSQVLTSSDAPAESDAPSPAIERDLSIVTLLPKDAIAAIFDPRFLTTEEADEWYDLGELVLGVEINGDARAYSIPFLSSREIVNDTVGGRKIAVTW